MDDLDEHAHFEYWHFDFIFFHQILSNVIYFILLLLYVRKYFCTRINPCQVTWRRRTLALWLGKLAIGLLTIERLHNVTRQFFCPISPAHFLSVLSAGRAFFSQRVVSLFFPFLGRSRFYSSPFHFLFTTTRDLYGDSLSVMTKWEW